MQVENEDIASKRILDIGCGYGWFLLNCLNFNPKSLVGTELDEKSLETANKFLSDSRLSLQVGSAINLPFDSNSFDTVTSWEVIEHIPINTEILMLKEVSRVLKFNGVFYLSTPNRSLICNSLDPAWWLIGHRHYSLSEIETLGSKAGLIIEKSVIKGGFWEMTSLLNMYFCKWILRRRPLLQEFFNKQLDKDFIDSSYGFTNIFIKFKKIS